MAELVRFRIKEINDRHPGGGWLAGFDILSTTLQKAIAEAGLPPLEEDYDHAWNDRYEYLIFDGVLPEHLPTIAKVSNEVQCGYQYPCHRNTSEWGDGGKWYEVEHA